MIQSRKFASLILLLVISSILNNLMASKPYPDMAPFKGFCHPDLQYRFDSYSEEIGIVDTYLYQPKNFTSINVWPYSRSMYFRSSSFPPYALESISDTHPIGLISFDKHAVILYPFVALNDGINTLCNDDIVEKELRSVNRNINLDVKPLVDIIALEDMSQYSNADTVAIYTLDLSPIGIDYMDKYNKCIGVYMRKYGHPALILKIMLDDEGYADKDKYIRTLFDNVRYGDKETILTQSEKDIKGSNFDFSPKGKWSYEETPMEYLNRTKPLYDELKAKWKTENDSLNRLPQ